MIPKAHEIREPDSISLTSSRSKSPELDEIKIIDPAKYTDTLDFQYVDFAKRTKPEESPTFRETVSIIQIYFFPFWSRESLAGPYKDLCGKPILLNHLINVQISWNDLIFLLISFWWISLWSLEWLHCQIKSKLNTNLFQLSWGSFHQLCIYIKSLYNTSWI